MLYDETQGKSDRTYTQEHGKNKQFRFITDRSTSEATFLQTL